MFPISDSVESRYRSFPILTILLILINAVVFFFEITAVDPDAFINKYALIPSHVDFTHLSTLLPFVTAMFLHGGFLHIISNMWFLWIFGDDVEANLGKVPYLVLYFAAGLLGNLLQYLIMPGSTIPMLGASGAIAGVLGVYFILFPTAKIRTLLFIFVFITLINVPAYLMLGYWFILQLFNGLGSIHSSPDAGGVAFFAHIGGFILGMIYGKIFGRHGVTYVEGQALV